MADENRNPLELDVVVRRFAESSDALSNVREQLQVLTKLGEAEERVNANLNWTAGQFERFAQEAAGVLRGLKESRTKAAKDADGMLSALQEAQSKLTDALSAATDLLDGTELKSISDTVARVAERMDALESNSATLSGKVDEQLEGMTKAVEANLKAVASLDRRIGEVERRVLELPGKVGEELQGVAKAVRANSQSIADVGNHVAILDARVSDLTNLITTLVTGVEERIGNLDEKIERVHADVKEPIIVKRFF